jgi:hypothetical protein
MESRLDRSRNISSGCARPGSPNLEGMFVGHNRILSNKENGTKPGTVPGAGYAGAEGEIRIKFSRHPMSRGADLPLLFRMGLRASRQIRGGPPAARVRAVQI